ncbi:MAG: transcription elongation factor Spt5 [Nanoarchaeota archaeon]|nr:transcription elongation factor Spt5 [Nanoarchaeota archaeon]
MSEKEDSQIYIVRVTAGRESQLTSRLNARLLTENEGVYAIMRPEQIKGYIFVEGKTREAVVQAIYGLRHAKGVIENPIAFDDVTHFFEPVAKKMVIDNNDIIELISGPYKGEKARVKRVDKAKEKVVVELLEAAVPIPITISLDSVRVIDRKGSTLKIGEE